MTEPEIGFGTPCLVASDSDQLAGLLTPLLSLVTLYYFLAQSYLSRVYYVLQVF